MFGEDVFGEGWSGEGVFGEGVFGEGVFGERWSGEGVFGGEWSGEGVRGGIPACWPVPVVLWGKWYGKIMCAWQLTSFLDN